MIKYHYIKPLRPKVEEHRVHHNQGFSGVPASAYGPNLYAIGLAIGLAVRGLHVTTTTTVIPPHKLAVVSNQMLACTSLSVQ